MICKIKNFLLLLFNFIFFAFFIRAYNLESYLAVPYGYICDFLDRIIPFEIFIRLFLLCYTNSIVFYFVAKRLGIIKFLDKFPFWIALIFVLAVDCVQSYYWPFYEDYVSKDYARWNLFSLFFDFCLGILFANCFLIYKFVKYLIRKNPHKYSFLAKFYPKFLEKTPDLILLIIAIIFDACSLITTDWKLSNDFANGIALHYYFFYVLVFVFYYKFFKIIFEFIKEKIKRNIPIKDLLLEKFNN